ncbi:MAG: hypothetical protein ACRDSR_01340 [Pseudonocardiaceae bacterium]
MMTRGCHEDTEGNNHSLTPTTDQPLGVTMRRGVYHFLTSTAMVAGLILVGAGAANAKDDSSSGDTSTEEETIKADAIMDICTGRFSKVDHPQLCK